MMSQSYTVKLVKDTPESIFISVLIVQVVLFLMVISMFIILIWLLANVLISEGPYFTGSLCSGTVKQVEFNYKSYFRSDHQNYVVFQESHWSLNKGCTWIFYRSIIKG